jgi:hypothetical protein
MRVCQTFGEQRIPVVLRGVTNFVPPSRNQNPGAQVVEIKKKLSFHMFLAVRRRAGVPWKTANNMRILQQITWSTSIAISRKTTTGNFAIDENVINEGKTIDYENEAPDLTVKLPSDILLSANDSMVVTRY